MPKDIFYFSKPDRIATVILLAVIIGTTVLRYSIPSRKPIPEQELTEESVSSLSLTISADSVMTPSADTVRRSAVRRTSGTGYSSSSASVRVRSDVPESANRDEPSEKREPTVKYARKKRPDAPVDLNSIDSVSLVRLPGIGPWYALRIVEYRDRLGGYCSVRQLAEIDGLPDSVMQWFVVTDTVPVRKLRVNHSSLSELRRHPYLNFYQARVIVELIRQHGPIKGPDRLSLMEEFSDQDLERLEPYLDYD